MNTVDEGLRIELGAQDLVRAVGKNRDAPVADKGDELARMMRPDLGAEVLGVVDA